MDMKAIETTMELLGQYGRDKVTGFSGRITTVSFDLYGCVQLILTPGCDKEGKPLDGHWYDVNRIDITISERCMPLPQYAAKQTLESGPAEKPAGRRNA